MKVLPLLFILCICLGCGKSGSIAEDVVRRDGEPPVTQVSRNSDLMNRAIAKAKATQKDFIAVLQYPKDTVVGIAIKKKYPTPNDGSEHIWLNDVTWDGTKFHGKVGDEPLEVKGLKLDDPDTVTPDEMSDWMYVDGQKLIGGYTIRALYWGGNAQERAEIDREMGPIKVPELDF